MSAPSVRPKIGEELRAERERAAAEAARYANAFPGWRPSSNSHRCPRVVAGKRCKRWGHSLSADESCACELGDRALDHARLWVKPDGTKALTGEPYNIGGEELAPFLEACHALGLRIYLSGHSPYFPGSTFLIVVERAL